VRADGMSAPLPSHHPPAVYLLSAYSSQPSWLKGVQTEHMVGIWIANFSTDGPACQQLHYQPRPIQVTKVDRYLMRDEIPRPLLLSRAALWARLQSSGCSNYTMTEKTSEYEWRPFPDQFPKEHRSLRLISKELTFSKWCSCAHYESEETKCVSSASVTFQRS